ncbi:uncharacterized protein [Centruroides vittatus]|uniref:uncharacterized protein n=1 Tax=Centruroides vittatus TaxID=120091 RepID=UPI00350FCB70
MMESNGNGKQAILDDPSKNKIIYFKKSSNEAINRSFPEIINDNLEDKHEPENNFNENIPQNVDFNEIEDLQINNLHPQIYNENTPTGSDDDDDFLKVPLSPTKKKKCIPKKAILLPKQLKYSIKH